MIDLDNIELNTGDILVGETNEKVIVIIDNNNMFDIYNEKNNEFIIKCEDKDDLYCFMDDSYEGIKKILRNKLGSIDLELLIHDKRFDKKELLKLKNKIEIE